VKDYKVIRKGYHARVGDLVREGWDTETRSIASPYTYGIVIKTQRRSPAAYTAEQIAEQPIRLIWILTSTGKSIRRYSVHVEVIGE
jgi:hypothetical protein